MMQQLRRTSVVAIGLTVCAFALDQIAWTWEAHLEVRCRGPLTLFEELFFALPMLLLLLGQLFLLRLPASVRQDNFNFFLSILLVVYILFSILAWSSGVWDPEILQECLNDLKKESGSFVFGSLHMLLTLPCAIFFVIAATAVAKRRYRASRRDEAA